MSVKIIAATLNVIGLCFIAFILVKEGLPYDSTEKLFACFLISVPVMNLWHIFLSKTTSSENFISLYFKRKSLEEQMKIAKLQESNEKRNKA